MARAPFQVLVFPYRYTEHGIRYAVLKRRKAQFWQGASGGGKGDETPDEAARREGLEEAGITGDRSWIRLETVTPIPVSFFPDRGHWNPDLLLVPEHSFGVEVADQEIHLSEEHSEFRWLGYEEACRLVRYDSNRTALWELHSRLSGEVVDMPHSVYPGEGGR